MFLKYWHAEKLVEHLQKAQEAVIKIQKGTCQYEEATSRFYGETCIYLVHIANPCISYPLNFRVLVSLLFILVNVFVSNSELYRRGGKTHKHFISFLKWFEDS